MVEFPPPDNASLSPEESNNNAALAPTDRPDYSKTPVNPNTGALDPPPFPFPSASGATGAADDRTMRAENESSAFSAEQKASFKATGNSGTQVFGGYFSEDYLAELRGRNGARKWDEIRRSEAQVALLMNAIQNPIKSANWDVEPFDQNDPVSVKQAELMKHIFFSQIDFNTFKHESLTTLPFGFSLFEMIHNVNMNHPKFGTFNGLRALSFRSQKTIENWILEPKTGYLKGVNQYTYSDLGGNQFIPGQFLLVITHSKEGDNYEGISVLRPMLGAYKRKDLYLKLAAIGVEKYAVGTPIGTVPKGKEKTPEFEFFKQVLENYTSHEAAYITRPEGWLIEIMKNDFDASKIKELLVFENTEMVNALVANFLILGMHGGGGAFALGSNLGEFFTSGIQAYADLVADAVNRMVIPNLVNLNFGPQQGYPKMKVTGISDKAGKELAETVKFLTDSRALDPDKPLKDHLRRLYKFPKADPDSAVALPAIPAGASANYPKPNDPVVNPKTGKIEPFNPSQLVNPSATLSESIQLAEKDYGKYFDKSKEKLKALMQENLAQMYLGLRQRVVRNYAQATGTRKILAAKGVVCPGVNTYKSALKDYLSDCAVASIAAARKKVPSKASVKLSDWDALPTVVRNLILAQSTIIADTQAAELEKKVAFQFTSSAANSDDIDDIMTDVDQTVEAGTGLNVDAAAGDALGHVVNQASMSFYLDEDVVDGIESFTFVNEDPISEICQEMEGVTVAPGDADLDKFMTPLHHNCKSRWEPNLVGASDNPEIDDGISLSKKALASMTL